MPAEGTQPAKPAFEPTTILALDTIAVPAQEEEEDLDGAEADFWDEEAAEDEHHRFMDPDPGRLQWVGGPPFRMAGGMPPPRGMEGGSFGATQVIQCLCCSMLVGVMRSWPGWETA